MKILITGGSGLLGSNLILELKNRNIEYVAPAHDVCDITKYEQLETVISQIRPNIIVHCAAIAKFADVETNPILALDANIIGTTNITKICIKYNIRLIFISTSHVFDGKKGMYDINDQINPLTKYSKTKAAGEYIVSCYENSLSIRTEFCGIDFPFDTAYTDKWSSKEYVDNLTPTMVDAIISNQTGITHIAGERKSFYDFGLERNPNVKPGSIKEIQSVSKVPILVDTILKCYNKFGL
jgi:dTDP-4-dehydrorhamnose reductase